MQTKQSLVFEQIQTQTIDEQSSEVEDVNKTAKVTTCNKVHFLDIPEEMIRYISGFLNIVDIVHLSGTCTLLFNLLPSYSIEKAK